jgi:hypothetical protein
MYLYDAYFYAFFFNPGSIHHRTDLTVSEDAGIEFNRNHSSHGKTELLTKRLHTSHQQLATSHPTRQKSHPH